MNAPTHNALHRPRSIIASVVLVVAVAIALLGVMAGSSRAAAGDTTRVSVSSTGAQANDYSYYPSISANGRFVAFSSPASNLVRNDTNRYSDIFVRDRQRGITKRVSVSSSGAQAKGGSWWGSTSPSISANGRFVAFQSVATNLVRNDTNGRRDVFVHDRWSGTTKRVSVSSSGAQATGASQYPSISADARFTAFGSAATNLVRNDTNDKPDIFVHKF